MVLSKENHVAFSDAIESGNTDSVRALLRQFPDLLNHPDWTPPPLHCAILWDQCEVVELLLDEGADTEMLDPDRQTTALRYAIMYCKIGVIPILLKRGANSGPIVDGGSSALELARDALAGNFKEFDDLPQPKDYEAVVETLLRHGISS